MIPAAAGCLHTSGSRAVPGAERPGSRTVDLEAWADEQLAPLLTLCSLGPFASRQTDRGAGLVAVWWAEFDLFACVAPSRIT